MTKTLKNRKGGFTLIELMIVVAIIGILAAIAIPNFLRFQLKAKSSEGKVNLAAIRTAEESYLAEYGTYVAAAATPTTAPSTVKQAWPAAAAPPVGFDIMGWSPEGLVYFQYSTIIAAAPPAFAGNAAGDLDSDTVTQNWAYSSDGVLGCALAMASPKTVSSCNVADGNSIF